MGPETWIMSIMDKESFEIRGLFVAAGEEGRVDVTPTLHLPKETC
jgi:hypothetical protein